MKMTDGLLVGFWVDFYLSKYVVFVDEVHKLRQQQIDT